MSPTIDVLVPAAREAHDPPEAFGRTRDQVRLMVSYRDDGHLVHACFPEIGRFLDAGDIVVVNTSGTLPAALPAVREDGTAVRLHLSTPLPGGLWSVEVREPAGAGSLPFREARAGDVLRLPDGGAVTLLGPYPMGQGPQSRLWLARLLLPDNVDGYLARHGRPVRYTPQGREWPIGFYQTVYATEPGSAEMPSAGRPFTPEIITSLVARGVEMAPLVLHTGVSSLEDHELPYPEPYQVPSATAARVNAAHRRGGRVVAVGTTVVRALETVADERGLVHPGSGWTELAVTPERGVRVVDGLLTGWHEPGASHLLLLEAVAGRPLLQASYEAALAEGYRWHEFGDLHLIL